ncbi:LysE family translocator [Streptomyces anulatus]
MLRREGADRTANGGLGSGGADPGAQLFGGRLFGQRSVLDDVLHDEGGSQTLDAGESGESLVVELLEGGQVGSRDPEEVVGLAEPAALTALTVAGAGYLLWLGWGVLRQPTAPTAEGGSTDASLVRVLLKGAGISGLNPKALLLYFSLFPQFIDPAAGWPVAAQSGLLSTVHLTACAVVYLAVGVLARTVLSSRPSAARTVTRVSGAMMIAIGAFLLVERLAG